MQLDLAAHPQFVAGDFWKVVYTAWAAGLFAVALPLGVWRVRRDGEWTLLLVVLGGLICSLGEPMMDQLCRVEFASDMPGPAFTGFGRAVPYFVPFCYASVISGTGYVVYRWLQTVTSTGQIIRMWAIAAVVDMVLEMPGTLAGAFRYFGDQPFSVAKFPLHIGVLNATGFFAIGFALHVLVPRLQGPWKASLLAVPSMVFWGSQTGVAWPAWMAVNWDMSRFEQHLAALGVVPLSLLAVKGMAEVVIGGRAVPAPERETLVAA